MKEHKTVAFCEHCNKEIEVVSPPTRAQYNQCLIKITGGTVLYPEKLANAKVKGTSMSVAHCGSFEGTYCNKTCLLKRIEGLLKA